MNEPQAEGNTNSHLYRLGAVKTNLSVVIVDYRFTRCRRR